MDPVDVAVLLWGTFRAFAAKHALAVGESHPKQGRRRVRSKHILVLGATVVTEWSLTGP